MLLLWFHVGSPLCSHGFPLLSIGFVSVYLLSSLSLHSVPHSFLHWVPLRFLLGWFQWQPRFAFRLAPIVSYGDPFVFSTTSRFAFDCRPVFLLGTLVFYCVGPKVTPGLPLDCLFRFLLCSLWLSSGPSCLFWVHLFPIGVRLEFLMSAPSLAGARFVAENQRAIENNRHLSDMA